MKKLLLLSGWLLMGFILTTVRAAEVYDTLRWTWEVEAGEKKTFSLGLGGSDYDRYFYYVDFGDGTLHEAPSACADTTYNKFYAQAGTYDVMIVVTSPEGRIHTFSCFNMSNWVDGVYSRTVGVTALDVRACTALEELWCPENSLTSLDLSKNKALRVLNCDSNRLKTLDLTWNTALETLSCNGNRLSLLDITHNTALRQVECYENSMPLSAIENVMGTLSDGILCGIHLQRIFETLRPGESLDWRSELVFNGVETTVDFSDISPAAYTFADGILTFHQPGEYHITMQNAGVKGYSSAWDKVDYYLTVTGDPITPPEPEEPTAERRVDTLRLTWGVEESALDKLFVFEGTRDGQFKVYWGDGDSTLWRATGGVDTLLHRYAACGTYNVLLCGLAAATEVDELDEYGCKNFTETACGMDLQMVFVSGGTFEMGATSEQGGSVYSWYNQDKEKPIHNVTLDGYYIGKFEVTQAQWKAVMGTDPSGFKGDNLPVENVSWYEVQSFCDSLSKRTGKVYRLPTEAEWEYAARGGQNSDGTKYAGSSDIDEVAWYCGNSGNTTHAVGSKKANGLGLYDMSGNVYEWCSDWYSDSYYGISPAANPQGPESADSHVLRGCGFGDYFGAFGCRVAFRYSVASDRSGSYFGFRVVCESTVPEPVVEARIYSISCPGENVSHLDVSRNAALKELNCERNRLTSLDVSGNAALEVLCCWENQLTSLDVSGNAALTSLICGDNQLTSLDVSGNAVLTYLTCGVNQLTRLDVSGNTILAGIECHFNRMPLSVIADLLKNVPDTLYECYVSPQRIADTLAVGEMLDWRSEMLLNGVATEEDFDKVPGDAYTFEDGRLVFNQPGEYQVLLRNAGLLSDEGWLDEKHQVASEVYYHITVTGDPLTPPEDPTVPDTLMVGAGAGWVWMASAGEEKELEFQGTGRGFRVDWGDGTTSDSKGGAETADVAADGSVSFSASKDSDKELKHRYAADGIYAVTLEPLSGQGRIKSLDVSDERVLALTFGDASMLEVLDCSENLLTALDLAQAEKLREVDFSDNRLTDLSLPSHAGLKEVDGEDNRLRLATLYTLLSNRNSKASYEFDPQGDSAVLSSGEWLDLSSEMTIGGRNTTTYTVRYAETRKTVPTESYEEQGGRFRFKEEGRSYLLTLQNRNVTDYEDGAADDRVSFTWCVRVSGVANEDLTGAASAASVWAYVSGRTIYVTDAVDVNSNEVSVYTTVGQRIYRGHGRAVEVPQAGVYILTAGERRMKVLVR